MLEGKKAKRKGERVRAALPQHNAVSLWLTVGTTHSIKRLCLRLDSGGAGRDPFRVYVKMPDESSIVQRYSARPSWRDAPSTLSAYVVFSIPYRLSTTRISQSFANHQ